MPKSLLLALAACAALASAASAVELTLWYAYERGSKEEDALQFVVRRYNIVNTRGVTVRAEQKPWSGYSSSLLEKVKIKAGPDLCIAPHDLIGVWVERKVLLQVDMFVDQAMLNQYYPMTMTAYRYKYARALWGLPISFKNLVLFYNTDYVKTPPATMNALLARAKAFTDPNDGEYGRWGLLYEANVFYFHAMWLQGFKGRIFRVDPRGITLDEPLLDSPAMMDSMRYVRKIMATGVMPPVAPDKMTMTRLFVTGKALFMISGQWTRGDIEKTGVNYDVAELPVIDETGARPVPFMTVEGIMMTRQCPDQAAAFDFMKFLTSPTWSAMMMKLGKQTPANMLAYRGVDAKSQVFKAAASYAIPMPNLPAMEAMWENAGGILDEVLRGANIEASMRKYQERMVARIRVLREELSRRQ